MTSPIQPLRGPRRFQWNAGGWFGAALGSSAWMIVTAGVLIFHDQRALALIPTITFAIVVAASVFLWGRRARIYPFTALMTLLCLLAVALPVVWIVVSTGAAPEALAAMNWPASTWATALAVLLVPVLVIWFVVLERSTPIDGQHSTLETTNVA